jgi:hypothetical protein
LNIMPCPLPLEASATIPQVLGIVSAGGAAQGSSLLARQEAIHAHTDSPDERLDRGFVAAHDGSQTRSVDREHDAPKRWKLDPVRGAGAHLMGRVIFSTGAAIHVYRPRQPEQ